MPSAQVITRARPQDSSRAESGSTASASVPVVAESTRLATDEDTPNCVDNVGSRPCTL